MKNNFVTDLEIREGYAEDSLGHRLVPEYLVRPGSVEEIVEVIRYCNSEGIGVTPAGERTCYTGASLTDTGVMLLQEKRRSILEINSEELFAIVEPGILLGDLKKELSQQGLFYAPDPSSENIASLGGTVGTNAGGARSFKYGQTSKHILGLEVVLADGRVEWVENYRGAKTSVGPRLFSQMTDLWVGSEGVLGIFSKIKIKLSQLTSQVYAIMAFFENVEDIVNFALNVRNKNFKGISPRSLEFLDDACLGLIRKSGRFPQLPAKGQWAIISEQEYAEGEMDQSVDAWLAALTRSAANVNDSIVANSMSKIVELRELRHYVPATLNERGGKARANGGKKVATDWAVPLEKMLEMIKQAEIIAAKYGFGIDRTYRFAHLGDGHPHYNFIAETTDELKQANSLRFELAKLAVSLGGTVAGEHGIGKTEKDLLALENPKFKLEILRNLKKELDPKGIMAPGNLI